MPHLVTALQRAVAAHAKVINISQDTSRTTPELENAIEAAVRADVVVIASAGNDGGDGKARTTYPGAYPGVLAVGASDRNNERASFSQAGDFVGVAAPGVDILSDREGGGYVEMSGTSMATPHVAGVAALVATAAPGTARALRSRLDATARDLLAPGRDPATGFGMVDAGAALAEAGR